MALTAYQSMWVAYYCTAETTGVERTLKPNEALTYYGIYTDQQCFIVRHKIIGNSPNSVAKYGHDIDPKHLLMLSPGWTMAQLATVIQTNAVPAAQYKAALVADSVTKAHDLFNEAMNLAATEAQGKTAALPELDEVFISMKKAEMKKGGAQ